MPLGALVRITQKGPEPRLPPQLRQLMGPGGHSGKQTEWLIHAAAPGAEECLCYGLPALRLGHKRLVAYGATPRHCALYPLSRATLAAFARELEAFDVSTGAIRFQPDEPLPPGLVRRIVQARIREDEPL